MIASRILVCSTFAMATWGESRQVALHRAFLVEHLAHGTDKRTLAQLWDILVGGPLPVALV